MADGDFTSREHTLGSMKSGPVPPGEPRSPGTQAREEVQGLQRVSRPGSRPAVTQVGGVRPDCTWRVEGPAF
jgi:hypothetical protein